MKSIRELVMSPEPDPMEEFRKNQLNLDGYEREYYNKNYGENDYKEPNKKEITISMTIEEKEIGPIGDYEKAEYDMEKANKKAIEIAYKRLEKLIEKDYKSKYKIEAEASEGYEDFEATIRLTPLK